MKRKKKVPSYSAPAVTGAAAPPMPPPIVLIALTNPAHLGLAANAQHALPTRSPWMDSMLCIKVNLGESSF